MQEEPFMGLEQPNRGAQYIRLGYIWSKGVTDGGIVIVSKRALILASIAFSQAGKPTLEPEA